ncbi:hypothetical protein CLAFUR0_09421 [Fulvia fulva]|nr:hypothetical protein CLAFUR0_09421 [Fulvia fulva]
MLPLSSLCSRSIVLQEANSTPTARRNPPQSTMRSKTPVILLTSLAGTLEFVDAAGNHEVSTFNQTAYAALPACGRQCVDSVSSVNDCDTRSGSCFCSSGNLTAAFKTCLQTGCKLPLDMLASQRYQADVCDYPFRSKQSLHRGVTWSVFVLATTFTAFRVMARLPALQGTGFSWDDYVVFFSYLLVLLSDVATEITLHYGSGLDVYRLTAHEFVIYTQWTYVSEILYNTVVITTKIAVVLLYLRIWSSSRITKAFRVTSWTIIGSLVVTCIAFDFGLIFQCVPVSSIWGYINGEAGQCVNLPALTYTFRAISICYDVLIFFLPIHSLMKLNIAWQRKVGVCFVFLVGFVVTICGIVRLQYLVHFNSKENPTWVFQPISMWSIIEINLSMVCICMPAAAGLAQRTWRWYQGNQVSHSAGVVVKQRDLSGSTANISELYSKDDKGHGFVTDIESGNDAQVDCETNLTDVEQAPARGEVHGRMKDDLEGGTVYELQSKSFDNEQPLSAASVLEQHNLGQYTPSPPHSGKEVSGSVHQAHPPGQQNKVEISHNPPKAASESAFSYRDDNDVVHQVTLTDMPESTYALPGGTNSPSPGTELSDLRDVKVKKKVWPARGDARLGDLTSGHG